MYRYIVLFYLMMASGMPLYAQKKELKAEYIVVCPTEGHSYANYRFVHTLSGDMEKREVTDTLLKNETIKYASDQGNAHIEAQPTRGWDIINNATRSAWVIVDGAEKTVVKEDYFLLIDSSFLIDSSAYYEIRYENKFKKIAGYNCQKVVLTNKLTLLQDSLYVNKALSHLNYRMTHKYGKIDFIMQGFVSRNGITDIFSVVLAKEIMVPSDFFEISKDYKRFESKKEFEERFLEKDKKVIETQIKPVDKN